MEKRYEFIERTLYLIREKMENNLPVSDTLENMILKRNEVLKQIMHEEVK